MQIFKNKEFNTGVEYRDPKNKKPIDGSVIIPDDSAEALAILAGHDFEIKGNGVEVKTDKRPEIVVKETEEKKLKDKRTREEKKVLKLRTKLAGKKLKDLDASDIKDIVAILAVKFDLLEEEPEEVQP